MRRMTRSRRAGNLFAASPSLYNRYDNRRGTRAFQIRRSAAKRRLLPRVNAIRSASSGGAISALASLIKEQTPGERLASSRWPSFSR